MNRYFSTTIGLDLNAVRQLIQGNKNDGEGGKVVWCDGKKATVGKRTKMGHEGYLKESYPAARGKTGTRNGDGTIKFGYGEVHLVDTRKRSEDD